MMQLGDVFDTTVDLPDVGAFYIPPERPHGTNPGYLPDVPPVEHEHWLMGEYWEPFSPYAIENASFRWSEYLRGTDLGMSAELYGRRFFYMGDTSKPSSEDPQWSTVACPSPAKCNDMIVVSQDLDPSDGIDVSPIFVTENGNTRWTPVTIPGVHHDFSPQLQPQPGEYWDTDINTLEPKFTVPTGIVKTVLERQGDTVTLALPIVMLWYGTGIAPDGTGGMETIDSSNPRTRPASWAGCTFDGKTFRACYENPSGDVVPFSIDEAPPDDANTEGEPSSGPGVPARFIQVAAVEVTSADFSTACTGIYGMSPLCQEFSDSGGGVLLYGAGRPYRKSGLFLAFIAHDEIGMITDTGKPVAHYWTGAGWSIHEEDAISLTGSPPCDNWRNPNFVDVDTNGDLVGGCWPNGSVSSPQTWDYHKVFGELSARLIRSEVPGVPPMIVLLNNNPWNGNAIANVPWVPYWKTPLAFPWSGSFVDLAVNSIPPDDTLTYGYGPYIIDAYSDGAYTGNDITLWHTISVWQGPNSNTPYGVYTGSEVIPWP